MARTLIFDIETSPVVAYVWQGEVHKARISNDKIISDMRIMSFGAKWLGNKGVFYKDIRGQINDKGEKAMLKDLHELLMKADIAIGHNGQAFDIPTVLARFAAFDFPPTPPISFVDTYLDARRYFKFTSNKLDFLARALGCPIRKYNHPNFPGMELWKECLNDNKKAWDEMKTYNIRDVNVQEWVYLKIRSWVKQHPNIALIDGMNGCPKCGRPFLVKDGVHVTKTRTYDRYRCTKCGAWTTDSKAQRTLANKVLKWEPI